MFKNLTKNHIFCRHSCISLTFGQLVYLWPYYRCNVARKFLVIVNNIRRHKLQFLITKYCCLLLIIIYIHFKFIWINYHVLLRIKYNLVLISYFLTQKKSWDFLSCVIFIMYWWCCIIRDVFRGCLWKEKYILGKVIIVLS